MFSTADAPCAAQLAVFNQGVTRSGVARACQLALERGLRSLEELRVEQLVKRQTAVTRAAAVHMTVQRGCRGHRTGPAVVFFCVFA